jgi:hypothetical protein
MVMTRRITAASLSPRLPFAASLSAGGDSTALIWPATGAGSGWRWRGALTTATSVRSKPRRRLLLSTRSPAVLQRPLLINNIYTSRPHRFRTLYFAPLRFHLLVSYLSRTQACCSLVLDRQRKTIGISSIHTYIHTATNYYRPTAHTRLTRRHNLHNVLPRRRGMLYGGQPALTIHETCRR